MLVAYDKSVVPTEHYGCLLRSIYIPRPYIRRLGVDTVELVKEVTSVGWREKTKLREAWFV